MPKLTTEEFIARAKAVHGDKYDYSKVEYVNTKTPVIVVCPKHGIYKVTPESHILRHQGCPICGKEKKGIPTTQEEFLERAIAIHGDKYDFSEAVYINSITKVKGVCSKHGEFWVIPSALIHQKAGCPLCAKERFSDIRRKSQEQFIEDCKRVWGEEYDYSQVRYINSRTPITVICEKHGPFTVLPYKHIHRHFGCKLCGEEKRGYSVEKCDTEGFIKKAKTVHGDKYDYSKVDYKENQTKVTIICPIHGEFEQQPLNHTQGAGCPMCYGNVKYTKETFIEAAKKVHGDKYDYSLVDYKHNKANIKIICPEHGVFEQYPQNHLRGAGCPDCFVRSHGEDCIVKWLDSQGIKYEREKKFSDCKDKKELPFDFWLPEHNLCIEFQGKQHFLPQGYYGGEEKLQYIQQHDQIKRDYCEQRGIKFIEIRYDENIEEVLNRELIK